MSYIIVFFSAFLFVLLFTPLAIKVAYKHNIVDQPKGLKKHEKTIPYLGGAAIFFAFFISLILDRYIEAQTLKGLGSILVGGSIVFLLGLSDDIRVLSIPTRFFGQIIAAVILLVCDVKIRFFPLESLNAIVTILWVVGLTNAFNIIDIMDGLASGVAFIGCLAIFFIGFQAGHFFSPLAALALAGACLGFLIYNRSPAKIFLGDAGSYFIGFTIAAISMGMSYSKTNVLAVFAPLFILIVPIFDTLFVMVMRARAGRSVFFGSKDHFPLRLIRIGWSKKRTLLTIYLASIIFCLIAIVSTYLTVRISAVVYLVSLLGILAFSRYLARIKV